MDTGLRSFSDAPLTEMKQSRQQLQQRALIFNLYSLLLTLRGDDICSEMERDERRPDSRTKLAGYIMEFELHGFAPGRHAIGFSSPLPENLALPDKALSMYKR